ncbi:uncharacterized protein [Ciconia boyciana]|uniref:uncharacterized protein isoform X4 n=1 Tax=Ciconia boyciana TaxID=52775 RepID=UPI003BA01728
MACQPALTLALLFLCAEAEGLALCHAPALQTKVFQYREGVLGPQPCLRARPTARHPGHPEWHPLPGQPPRQPAHPAAAARRHQGAAPGRGGLGRLHLLPLLQGRAVALRVGRQPRLVPLHLGSRPPAPGALPAPRRHPPPRLLLPALLNPPRPCGW